MDYKKKYLKYKEKYLYLKKHLGGGNCSLNIDYITIIEKNTSENNNIELSANEKKNPYVKQIEELCSKINIINIPEDYNFLTFLKRAMIIYTNNIKLLRPFEMLFILSQLPCTKDSIKIFIDGLNQKIIDRAKKEGGINFDNKYILRMSHVAANNIAKILLEGYDLANLDNFIWAKKDLSPDEKKKLIFYQTSQIPDELCTRDKQTYIIEEMLEIVSPRKAEDGRMIDYCKNIQEDINGINEYLVKINLNELYKYVDSIPEKERNTYEYYLNIKTICKKFPIHNIFHKSNDNIHYKKIGYDPFDKNVSREDPEYDLENAKKNFAYIGNFLHPNYPKFFKNSGKKYILNINNKKRIHSDGFIHLRYDFTDVPSSTEIDKYGKFIKKYEKIKEVIVDL
jgi:hypothetical protein